MTPLPSVTRDRLGACLALAEAAANPHDGERLAALAAAERLLEKHGLRLRDLRPDGTGGETRAPEHIAWRETVRRCRAMPGALRPWESGFLRGLDAFPRLSKKQRAILAEIAERMGVVAAAS